MTTLQTLPTTNPKTTAGPSRRKPSNPDLVAWSRALAAAVVVAVVLVLAGRSVAEVLAGGVQTLGLFTLLGQVRRRGRFPSPVMVASALVLAVMGVTLHRLVDPSSATVTVFVSWLLVILWAAVAVTPRSTETTFDSIDVTEQGPTEPRLPATGLGLRRIDGPATALLAAASALACGVALVWGATAGGIVGLVVMVPGAVAVVGLLGTHGARARPRLAASIALALVTSITVAGTTQAVAWGTVVWIGLVCTGAALLLLSCRVTPAGSPRSDGHAGLVTLRRDDLVLLVGVAGLIGIGMGAGLSATLASAAVVIADRFLRAPGRGALRVEATPVPVDDAKTRSRVRLVVGAATAVGFALRLAAPRGLWLDELTQYHQARLSLVGMLQTLYTDDNHPPLYYLVQWVSIRVIGNSELALRLPSMVIGTLLIPLLYVVGRDLYDRRVGALAAVLGAVAPIAVWYGQEARMYALFMLLSLVGLWAVARIIRGDSGWWFVVLVAANSAVVLTQWFAVLHVIALNLVLVGVAIARRRSPDGRDLRRSWIISVCVQGVVLLPAFVMALHQFAGNQTRGLGFVSDRLASGSAIVPPPGVYTLLTNLEWALFGYQSDRITRGIVALWPVALLAVLLLMGRARRGANRYLLVVVIVPVLGMYAASLMASNGRSLAEVRYFAGAVPALILLIAATLHAVLTTRRARVWASAALVLAMLAGVGGQLVERDNPRVYGYRTALTEVADRAQPGDQLLYAPFFMDVVVSYYSPAIPVTSLEEQPLPDHLDGTVYVLMSPGFADTGDGAVHAQQELDELRSDHRLVDVIRAPNVEIEVYQGADS